MAGRRRPARKALSPLFTNAIVLDDKRVMLCEIGPLYIGSYPGSGASIRASQHSRLWPQQRISSSDNCRAISMDIIRCQDEIQIALSLCQSPQYALLRLVGSAYRYQFNIGISYHNDAVGCSAAWMDATAAHCQS